MLHRLTPALVGMLSLNAALAQCPIPTFPTDGYVNIVEHFGACPDDDVNDHDAFVKAANYFNARNGQGVLFIPAGEYIVGRQSEVEDGTPNWTGGNTYLSYKHLLELRNCTNLRIRGEVDSEGRPASKIRFKDCMRYGLFDPNYSGPGDMRYVGTCDELDPFGPNASVLPGFQAHIGQMVVLRGCSNVNIQDLELDGNSGKYTLGGPSDQGSGIQLPSDGIRLGRTGDPTSVNTNITIRNVNAHHFGRDGLLLVHGSAQMDLLIEDCHFDHNGRTGFAWSSGEGLTVLNSTFDHNATARIRSQTASGMDIEYHNDGPVPAHGRFVGCSFEYNLDAGVSSGPAHVSGEIEFMDCSFKSRAARYDENGVYAPSSYSIEAPAPWLRFTGCEFYGPARVGFNSEECEAQDGDAQRFIDCTFSEEDGVNTFYDWRFTDFTNQVAPSMVLGNTASGTVFEGCHFLSNCRARFLDIHGALSATGCSPCVNDVVIKDCSFRNTGLWAELANTQLMFTLNGGGGPTTTWINNTMELPSMIRLQNPPFILGDGNSDGVVDNLENYRPNLSGYLSSCGNLYYTTYIQGNTLSLTAMAQFFAAHPCLPILPEPPIARAVIGCQASEPIRQLVDDHECHKFVKSAPAMIDERSATALVHHGILNVLVPGTDPISQAVLIDATGKLVGSVSLSPGANEVHVDHLALGTYFLSWEGGASPVRFVIMP
jgi:hypothetical protein